MNKQGSYQSHFQKAKAAKSSRPRPTASRPTASAKLTEAEVEAQLRRAFGMKETHRSQSPKKKRKASFSLYPVISLSALFIGISSYMLFPIPFEELFSHIEISYMGQAQAKSEGQKLTGKKSGEEAKASPSQSKESSIKDASVKSKVSEDTSYLSKLRERKAELDLREAELNQLEEELQRQKVEIEKRITELTQIREEIATKLEDRVEADEGKVKKLVELYSSMKPKQAAKIIETVNTDLAVEVLANMKKKSAADIMNVMDEKVAKELSERLTGYKRTPTSAR